MKSQSQASMNWTGWSPVSATFRCPRYLCTWWPTAVEILRPWWKQNRSQDVDTTEMMVEYHTQNSSIIWVTHLLLDYAVRREGSRRLCHSHSLLWLWPDANVPSFCSIISGRNTPFRTFLVWRLCCCYFMAPMCSSVHTLLRGSGQHEHWRLLLSPLAWQNL